MQGIAQQQNLASMLALSNGNRSATAAIAAMQAAGGRSSPALQHQGLPAPVNVASPMLNATSPPAEAGAKGKKMAPARGQVQAKKATEPINAPSPAAFPPTSRPPSAAPPQPPMPLHQQSAPMPHLSQVGVPRSGGPFPSASGPLQGTGISAPTPTPPTQSFAQIHPPPIPDDLSQSVTPVRPEVFGPARPTLNQGLATMPMLATPAITRPPMTPADGSASAASGAAGGAGGGATSASAGSSADKGNDANRVVSKRKISELVGTIDPDETLDGEVEDVSDCHLFYVTIA